MIPFKVTEDPPTWSNAGRPAERNYCFYIAADTSGGWPVQAQVTLCKFGVTTRPLDTRCDRHQRKLRSRWGIEANLEMCFAATGKIASEKIEEEVKEHTISWLAEGFGKNAEWRRCCPRQLARVAVLATEAQLSQKAQLSQEVQLFREGPPAQERRFLTPMRRGNMRRRNAGEADRGEPTRRETAYSLAACRLSVPGCHVRLEPIRSLGPFGSQCSSSSQGASEAQAGRPLREPRPELGPNEPGLWEGQVSSKTGLSHRWLRQRSLFAEWRSLVLPTGSENAEISFRASPLKMRLIAEAQAASVYRTSSEYLRATAAGRDCRGPIAAKAGALLYWSLCHLGRQVGAEEWARLGALLKPLLGIGASRKRSAGEEGPGEENPQEKSPEKENTGEEGPSKESAWEEIRKALLLVRRHLRAAQFQAAGDPIPPEALPQAPEPIRTRAQQTALAPNGTFASGRDASPGQNDSSGPSRGPDTSKDGPAPSASLKIQAERKQLIRENAFHGGFSGMSGYLRHMAIGGSRAPSVLARCAAVARWAEAHLGMPVGRAAWNQLEESFQETFGLFLFGPAGERDIEDALQEGAKHLLGASTETIAQETGMSLEIPPE